MSSLNVVKADLSMVPALLQLSAQLGYERTIEEISAQLEKIIAREDHQFLAAILNNEIVGWAHFHQVHPITSISYVEVSSLVVDQSCRRQGVGQALMQAGEDWAASQGIKVVRVRSRVQRKDAHAFYERVGYECIKEQKTFLKNLPVKP